ncbi:hypothetical protein MMC28_001953 [Mycoblastus sanguinarius]|nr:hypothetical protein [Mycoblastus sanguinarius]
MHAFKVLILTLISTLAVSLPLTDLESTEKRDAEGLSALEAQPKREAPDLAAFDYLVAEP